MVDASYDEDDDDDDNLLEPDDELLFDDEDDDEEDHPLQVQAQELAMRAMDVVQQNAEPGTPAYQLVTCLLQVSGKLAGALNDRDSDYEPETGFVLAILKRCLNWLNEAVGCLSEVDGCGRRPGSTRGPRPCALLDLCHPRWRRRTPPRPQVRPRPAQGVPPRHVDGLVAATHSPKRICTPMRAQDAVISPASF